MSNRRRGRPAHGTLLAVLLVGSAHGLEAATLSSGGATFRIEGGYDSEVLADPEGLGVVEGVGAPFLASSLDLDFGFGGIGGERGRLRAGLRASRTGYAEEGPESDLDLRGRLMYDRPFRGVHFFNLRAEGGRFRRGSLPLFDLNHAFAEASLTRAVGDAWYAGARTDFTFLDYPGRYPDDEGAKTERDRRTGAALSLSRRFGAAGIAEFSAGFRACASNDSLAEYAGPAVSIRAVFGDRRRLLVIPYVTFSARTYGRYPVLEGGGEGLVDTGEERRDVTWRAGGTVERRVAPRLSLVLDGAVLRQTSNIADFEFDQIRVAAGVSVDLWRGTERAFPSAPDRPLAPVRIGDGRYRFVCREAEAREVFLVGGFNGWRIGADPMERRGEIWTVEVELPEGEWRYAFVVDGEWRAPEGAARYEEDGFGGVLGIVDGDL